MNSEKCIRQIIFLRQHVRQLPRLLRPVDLEAFEYYLRFNKFKSTIYRNSVLLYKNILISPVMENWHLNIKALKVRNGVYGSVWERHLRATYGASPAIWDHTITCHPTQVNAPSRLQLIYPNKITATYLPRRDGRLNWPWCLVIYRDSLTVKLPMSF